MERINLSALAAVTDCPDLIELPFVRDELSSAEASSHRLQLAGMLLKGCARFSGHYSQADYRQLLQRCRSFDDLRDRYNQLHDRFNLGLARHRGCVQQEEACRAALQHRIQGYDEHRRQRLEENRRAQERELHRQLEQRLRVRRLAEQRLVAAEQQALRELDQQRVRSQAAPSVHRKGSPFPPPPLPGNEYIQPLTTPEELRSEGLGMQNCVGDGPYDLDVRRGRLYIYRVLSPERCTLEIKIGSSGRLSLGQLKTRGNASPNQATKRFVQDWLHGRHTQPQARPPAAPPPRPRPGQGKLL